MRRASSRKATASAVALLTIALLVGPTATAALAVPTAQKLAFTTAAQSLIAGVTSSTITVQLRANNGSAVNASSNVTVSLTGTSAGGLFRNTADTATITAVTIPSGTNNASFKYKDTLAGTPTITASAPGLSSATQNETVNAAAFDHIAVAPKASTIGIGASQSYTATAFDQFNNGLGDVTSSTTFTIAPDGSCDAATCSATAIGAHTVTANDAGKTDTATLTVSASAASMLAVTTAPQSITAGITSNTIAVHLQTSAGSPVNASSTITVNLSTNSAGGVFRNTSDNATITTATIPSGTNSASFKYRDTIAGTPTITASATGLTSGSQNETVNPGALDRIAISPKTSTIASGSSQTYSVTAFDQLNNSRGDATASTTFAISPNGSCNNATASCTATSTGAHTVTATVSGRTDTATLTVVAVASKLAFTLGAQTMTAGVTSGTITVQQQTSTGAAANATSDVIVSLSTDSSGGVFRTAADTAAITTVTIITGSSSATFKYKDTLAGSATITASATGLTSAAQTETVSAAALDHIAIIPKTATVAAGVGQAYTATGFDQFNNSRGDVTGSTSFTIAPNGSCSGSTCQATTSGAHTVTGTNTGKTDTATLSVNAGGAASITISPKNSSVQAGAFQTYTVSASDQFGNSLGDVTAQTTFSIAPNGTCNASQCTATIVGVYTVTAADGSAVTTATLTIKPTALDHIVLSPADATIGSGGSQTYTAEGFDVYGNSRGDITSVTSFSITPDGSCTANVCAASITGSHTVRGVRGTKSATAILHVTPGGTTSITISPSSATVAAGVSQTYGATGSDQFGNSLGDVTGDTTFSISPDGSCTANVCTATVAGPHTVTGTDGSFADDASLTVNAGALTSIVVSPADATIAAGDSQTYTAEGFDAYGNSKGDRTSTVTFTITPNGSCSANVCTASVTGDHVVRGAIGGASSTATLHVISSGALASIAISPSSATVAAGVSQTYGATGSDQFGNSLGDVTGDTTFSISPDGSCTANVCTATVAGPHTVTGTDGSFADDASLTVNAGALTSIVVSPADATIAAGDSQTYTAEGFDAYGNSKGDRTSTVTFTITPNGSCSANVCTASVTGDHVVRGAIGGASSTATLHVISSGALASITISPSSATVAAGVSQTYGATGSDQFGNSLGDVTGDTTFSISPDGSCTANVCTATVAGPHTVTGTDGSFADDASLTVNAGGLNHITITPQSSTIALGDSQTYTVEGFDAYGNSRGDLTSTTTFTITPNGSCTANVCTASVSGLHSVRAQKGAATATATLQVGAVSPAIASISPTTGKVSGSVVITGSGFIDTTDVAFSSVSATFVIDSDTQITATVPNGALTGKISVIGPGGTAVSSATFKVQPSITGFSPTSGPVGTAVVIAGSAFTGATAVTFNGIAAAFTVDSYSQITATVPCCGASGKIKVTTTGGSGSSQASYKVPASITGFTPGSGPVGTTVVITGIAFTGATAVAVNGIVATTFTVDSDTQITVVVPAGATTGKIKVTTGGGAVSSSTTFTVTP